MKWSFPYCILLMLGSLHAFSTPETRHLKVPGSYSHAGFLNDIFRMLLHSEAMRPNILVEPTRSRYTPIIILHNPVSPFEFNEYVPI